MMSKPLTPEERSANFEAIRKQCTQYMNDRTMVTCGSCAKNHFGPNHEQ